MNRNKAAYRVVVGLMMLVTGALTVRADWTPTTGGTYDYGSLANWAGSVINNVFLPTSYAGTAQTITLASDAVWNTNAAVVTAHTNGINLLLRGNGSDRNLVLRGGISAQGGPGQVNNYFQFGTVNANEKINFTMPETVTINASADFAWYTTVIVNGGLGGAGGLNKTGNGNLYLENAASTFTGTLNIGAGQFVLATASATLSTENIVIGRQDAFFRNSDPRTGVIGLLALGNGPHYPPVGTSVGATGANANRISDTATVDMRGGNIPLTAKDVDLNSLTENVGTVNLTRGVNGLTVCQASFGTSNVVTLAITNLNRAAGTGLTAMNGNYNLTAFAPFGTRVNVEGRVTFGTINLAAPSAAVINGIIPWAVNASQVSGYYWATVYNGDFLTYGDYGLTPATGFATDVNTAGPTANVRLTTSPTLSADRTVNSLTVYGSEFYGGAPTHTLTLAAGAVNLVHTAPAGGRYSVTANLDFSGREGIIFVHSGRFQLGGSLGNTGGNGLTYNGLGGKDDNQTSQLWFDAANSYTGPTRINGGVLRGGGNTVPSSTAVVISEGGGLDLRQNDTTIGSLSGWGHVWFLGTLEYDSRWDADSTCTLTVGGDGTSTTYAGAIDDSMSVNNYTGRVVKVGSGTLTPTSTNAYTGSTTVSGGGLVVDGRLATTTNGMTVQSSAFLGGTGTIARAVTVNSGALLAAGLTNTIGTLSISSNLNLQSGAILNVQIAGTGSYDRIVVGGAVNLNSNSGAGSVLQLSVTGTLHGGEQYRIIDNQSGSAVSGTFSNATSLSAGGYGFSVAYDGGTGNDVVLTVLPKGTLINIR